MAGNVARSATSWVSGFDQFATMLGGYGEEVRDPYDIQPALQRARASRKP